MFCARLAARLLQRFAKIMKMSVRRSVLCSCEHRGGIVKNKRGGETAMSSGVVAPDSSRRTSAKNRSRSDVTTIFHAETLARHRVAPAWRGAFKGIGERRNQIKLRGILTTAAGNQQATVAVLQ